eukprot:gene2320-2672_t
MSSKIVLSLHRVLYAPPFTKNLLSVLAMTLLGAEVIFNKRNGIVKKNGKEYMIGNLAGSKLYKMNAISEYTHVSTESCKPSKELLHCRFGHVNYNYIDQMKRKELVHGMDLEANKDTPNRQCEACILRRMQKKP